MRVRAGFTTVELVMVMVIVATLATVAYARFGNRGMDVQTEADLLLAHLRYAQQWAMSNGTDAEVVLTSSPNGHFARTVDGQMLINPLGGGDLQHTCNSAIRSQSSSLSSSPQRIIFDHRLGTPHDGTTPLTSASTVTLSGPSSSVTVVIHPNTGFAEVQ